jgi:hypothetical protein
VQIEPDPNRQGSEPWRNRFQNLLRWFEGRLDQ